MPEISMPYQIIVFGPYVGPWDHKIGSTASIGVKKNHAPVVRWLSWIHLHTRREVGKDILNKSSEFARFTILVESIQKKEKKL